MSKKALQQKSFLNSHALQIAMLVIFGVIIWFIYYSQAFQGLVYGDAHDYAGIARNLYRGQGFISDEIMPLQLAFKKGLPQPNLWRAPLHILAIAATFSLFGLSNRSIALASIFFFFTAIPAVYLLIRRLFSPKIAFLGTLIFLSSPYVLSYSISGLTESMAWLWRSYTLMGNPFFSLMKFEIAMYTRTYPGYSLHMIPQPISILEFLFSHFRDIIFKVIQGLGTFYLTFPTAELSGIGEYVMIFFIASIFHRFDQKQERFRWLVYSMILVQMVAMAFIHNVARWFFVFAPFFAAYGVAFFAHLVDKLRISTFNRNLIYVLATIFFILPPLVRAINPFDQDQDTRPYTQEQIRYIKSLSSRNEAIATDIPSEISWYADRVAIDIPLKPQMMEKIEERIPVQAVFLSSLLDH